jgi:hypothetical protein
MQGTCGIRKQNFLELHRMVSSSIGALAPQHFSCRVIVTKEASHG